MARGAARHEVIAIGHWGPKLLVAIADPLNVVALDDVRRASGLEVDFKIGGARAIRDAIGQQSMGRPYEAVAKLHPVVKEAKRAAGLVALEPEGQLAEVNGQRVQVVTPLARRCSPAGRGPSFCAGPFFVSYVTKASSHHKICPSPT